MRISSIPTCRRCSGPLCRSEEHTSELHHLVISYAVFCLKKKIDAGDFHGFDTGLDFGGFAALRKMSNAFDKRAWHCLKDNGLFFFNDTAATEIYTLSLHDALPI